MEMFADEIRAAGIRAVQSELDRAVWLDSADLVEVCDVCSCHYAGEHWAACTSVTFPVAA